MEPARAISQAEPAAASLLETPLPVCVDLDGTLCLTDTLQESAAKLLRVRPVALLLLPLWLLRGKAYLKARLASECRPDPALLPYRGLLLELLRARFERGLDNVLVTGAAGRIAADVAAFLGVFRAWFSSTDTVNLVGERKAARVVEAFGENQFVYVGDSGKDLAVWRRAAGCLAVHPPPGLQRRLSQAGLSWTALGRYERPWRAIAKALRLHQWSKNLLVFVPLLMSHRYLEVDLVLLTLAAFLAFGLCGSSAYLLNDLVDLESDRRHPVKRRRPFASGQAPLWTGLVLFPLLAAGGLAMGGAAGTPLLITVLAYIAGTVLYSLFLRHQLVLDVVALALLYTLRVVAGVAATGVEPSNWLFAFSGFLFLGFALMKRYSEILAQGAGSVLGVGGRAYLPADGPVVQMAGIASGMMAILVMALYIENSPFVAEYHAPLFLWAWIPLLSYYLIRMWIVTGRGQLDSDPILYTIRDRHTYYVAAIGLIILALARWVRLQ